MKLHGMIAVAFSVRTLYRCERLILAAGSAHGNHCDLSKLAVGAKNKLRDRMLLAFGRTSAGL